MINRGGISIPLRYNLELTYNIDDFKIYPNFNSTKVQFGDLKMIESLFNLYDFNSTKVQFGALTKDFSFDLSSQFQFH